MRSGSARTLFASTLQSRLTDPRILGLQLGVVLGTVLAVHRYSLVSASNPVLTLVGIPILALLALFMPVGLVQDLTLRLEEQSGETDDLIPCWLWITDRLFLWINAAFVVPMLIWGVPITGTLGYTAEALGPLVLGEELSADHSLGAVVVVSLVLLGSAWATLGYLAALRVYLGPTLGEDRIRMYLGLRSSLPSKGEQSLAPLVDGGQADIDTEQLADACVEFILTQIIPDDLPEPVDIERLAEHVVPQQASVPALFVFHITMNRRFLSVLLGSMLFAIATTFGLAIESIDSLTVALGAALGVLSQVAVDHPFLSVSRMVLK